MIHGLCLSGGGANGSFEAGGAAAIGEHYQHSNSPITMLSGTSVGALNAAGIAAKGWRFPMELWWDISDRKVYRKSRFLFLWRVWQLGAIYDSRPLLKFIKSKIKAKDLASSDFRLFIHATKLGCRQPVIFTGKHPDAVTGIFASASIPGAFPPVKWQGHWLVDGGTVDNSPIRALIRSGCEMITVIHLDDEMPAPPIQASEVEPVKDTDRPRIAETLAMSIEAMMDAHFQRDLKNVQLINRMVDAGCAPKPGHRKIHLQIFGPKTELGGSLDFNTKRMRILVDRGYHRALAWLRDEAIEP